MNQYTEESTLFPDVWGVLIELFQHIDSPIIKLYFLFQFIDIVDGVIVFLDPLKSIVNETTINIDPLFEIADHLVIFGAHVELSDMVIFQFQDELWQLCEFTDVKVIVHHQVKNFTFFCVKI